MRRLYVLFDGECSLCGRCRSWLARQPALLELHFLPFQSPEVARRFPGIGALHPEEQLLVVSDEGGVYRGPHAWIMCLYALRNYREWSYRLAHPALLPWARRACEALSENRFHVSRWLELVAGVENDAASGGYSSPSHEERETVAGEFPGRARLCRAAGAETFIFGSTESRPTKTPLLPRAQG